MTLTVCPACGRAMAFACAEVDGLLAPIYDYCDRCGLILHRDGWREIETITPREEYL